MGGAEGLSRRTRMTWRTQAMSELQQFEHMLQAGTELELVGPGSLQMLVLINEFRDRVPKACDKPHQVLTYL